MGKFWKFCGGSGVRVLPRREIRRVHSFIDSPVQCNFHYFRADLSEALLELLSLRSDCPFPLDLNSGIQDLISVITKGLFVSSSRARSPQRPRS